MQKALTVGGGTHPPPLARSGSVASLPRTLFLPPPPKKIKSWLRHCPGEHESWSEDEVEGENQGVHSVEEAEEVKEERLEKEAEVFHHSPPKLQIVL